MKERIEQSVQGKDECVFSRRKAFRTNSIIKSGTLITTLIVATIATLLLTSCGLGGVPADRVRQDVAMSDIVTKGLVPSAFVEETPYNLVELKIDKQFDEEFGLFGIEKARKVEFSGKIENESFSSDFIGHAYYMKEGNTWATIFDPASDSSTTVPVKGVDSISTSGGFGTSISNGSEAGESITEFTSTLDTSSGGFSSEVRQINTIEYWFATDTIETAQTFVFNAVNGWEQSSTATVVSSQTTYKLAGKKFSGTADSIGIETYTLVFTDVKEDGTATADYTIEYDPAGREKDFSYGTLFAVHETGEATGQIIRTPGERDFKVELNDPSLAVTFSCTNSLQTISAGSGTVNTLSAKVRTDIPFGSKDLARMGTGLFDIRLLEVL
jgi:hypothetical protein